MLKSKFFEYGEVELEIIDKTSRKLSVRVCLPCCLMQAITPAFLGAGLIDQYELRNPIAVWLPKISEKALIPLVAERVPELAGVVEQGMKGSVETVLAAFQDIGQALQDPSYLVPMLPMGAYVKFRYRGTTDKFADALFTLESHQSVILGMAEFRFACAEILARVLTEFDHVA